MSNAPDYIIVGVTDDNRQELVDTLRAMGYTRDISTHHESVAVTFNVYTDRRKWKSFGVTLEAGMQRAVRLSRQQYPSALRITARKWLADGEPVST